MTSNVFMFPTIERLKQVRQERLAMGTDTLTNYFLISAGAITPGDRPNADVFDLDAEREKRKS